jgi:tRNA(Leu) C34 or U34 (ribose-2'-O)-methylase TrmL
VLSRGSQRPLAERLRLFTARGGRVLFDVPFEPDDVLVLGSETVGLPPELLEAHPEGKVYIPIRPGVRSLNLANVACLALYTALNRSGHPLPANQGAYVPHPQAAEDIWPTDIAVNSPPR